jgi:catechol 2,3-dioxygenase-like lactoylglutathione lyase family enzyme
MLGSAKLMAFVATSKPEEARRFYESVLGLLLVEDNPFALVFDAGGRLLRIQKVDTPVIAPYTSLGWEVSDITDAVKELVTAGARFEHFDGMPQDDAGIWRTPDGSAVAWFKDPDGNLLSLTQFA